MLAIKSILKIFLIFQLILLQVSSVVPEIQGRIVGGEAANIRSAPYVVQLLDNGRFFCGGTLVAPNVVVTAAHCVKGISPDRLSIAAGTSRLSDRGVRAKVHKVMTPRGYDKDTMTYDVAVLKLRTAVKGNNIRPIGLCTKTWKAGDILQVYGWGLRHEFAYNVSNQLQTVKVRAIAKSRCQQLYGDVIPLSKTMSCASIPGAKDACSGDSGGPAIMNGELCGIVSWGVGCARRYYPGVYTNVMAVKNFINNAMKK
ncbi:trypsin beta-like [Cochliomyia hominivorax]